MERKSSNRGVRRFLTFTCLLKDSKMLSYLNRAIFGFSTSRNFHDQLLAKYRCRLFRPGILFTRVALPEMKFTILSMTGMKTANTDRKLFQGPALGCRNLSVGPASCGL